MKERGMGGDNQQRDRVFSYQAWDSEHRGACAISDSQNGE